MAPTAEELEPYEGGASETHSVVEARLGQVAGGTYRISRYLGSGGSSHVFEAEHVRLGKRFALKLLRTEIDSGRRASQRFRREAKAVARLQSEHIVSVVDCGELPDQTPYLVMELLEGGDLRSLLRSEGALPARRAIQLMIEASRGLSVVHGAGLVHRDLKPENLFVTRRATGEDWCKILDFGVAKMEASLGTAEGAIVGTARYMAPEQLVDSASVGPATDVYALGAILYECLSGRAAHAGDTIQQVMFSVVHSEPEPLSKLCPTLPAPVLDVIGRCLAKAPTERPQSAAELEALLAAALERRSESGVDRTLAEDAAPPRFLVSQRPLRRFSSGQTLLLTAFATMVGGASVLAWPGRAPKPQMAVNPSPQIKTTIAEPGGIPTAAELKPSGNLVASSAASPESAPPARGAALRLRVPPSAPRLPNETKAPPVGNLDQTNPYGE